MSDDDTGELDAPDGFGDKDPDDAVDAEDAAVEDDSESE